MKENNELIAEFMGIKLHDGMAVFDPTFNEPPEELQYHSSWDWLMPVVEKIEKLHSANFKYDMDQITSGNWPKDNEYMQVIAAPLATPIGEVYEKIIDFIKWYNTKL